MKKKCTEKMEEYKMKRRGNGMNISERKECIRNEKGERGKYRRKKDHVLKKRGGMQNEQKREWKEYK